MTARVRAVQQTKGPNCSAASAIETGGANAAAAYTGAVLTPPACRYAEDRRIRQVDELGSKGRVDPLGDWESLGQVEVGRLETRTTQLAGRAIAKLAVVCSREGCGVEIDFADATANLDRLHCLTARDAYHTVWSRLVGTGK